MSDALPTFDLLEPEYAAGSTMSPHAHDSSSVGLVLRGEVRERVAGAEEVARSLAVVVKPAGVRHSDTFGPGGTRLFTLVLDGGLELGDYRWLHEPAITRCALELLVEFRRGAPRACLDGGVRRLLSELSSRPRTTRGPAPSWLESARSHLLEGRGTGARTREAAAVAGVHPVHLARSFRRHFGLSPREQLGVWRLEDAAHQLTSGDAPLAAIAHDSGFADQPHLTRVFRQRLGLSPGRFRRLVADGA